MSCIANAIFTRDAATDKQLQKLKRLEKDNQLMGKFISEDGQESYVYNGDKLNVNKINIADSINTAKHLDKHRLARKRLADKLRERRGKEICN
jgi:hypothetical protein